MAPNLAQSAVNNSVIRVAFVEVASFTIILIFLLFSLLTHNESLSLIVSPQFIILLFMALNTPLQVILHLVVYPVMHADEGLDSYSRGKSKFRLDKVVKTACGALVAFAFLWIIVHVIAVLFGAHFIQDFGKTTLWAAMVSSMIVTPGICILGPKARKWIALFNFRNFDSTSRRRFYYCVICTSIGCWLSPVVVPLDWDRPWQAWPIPGVVGALLGYCGGLLVSGCKILKDMKFSKLH